MYFIFYVRMYSDIHAYIHTYKTTKQYSVVLISSKVIIPLHGWPHCIASSSFNFELPAELLSRHNQTTRKCIPALEIHFNSYTI